MEDKDVGDNGGQPKAGSSKETCEDSDKNKVINDFTYIFIL